MEKIYLMAVDLGTTFIKAAVYDTEGTQISSARAAVISDSSRPGVFLQSGTEIYRSVLAAMKSAAQSFDLVICDSGANIEHGLALGALFASDCIYMVLDQSESAFRPY